MPGGLCGKCTFCKTGSGIEFDPAAEANPDPAQIRAILNACPDRDDPRLLARMAFGITSPRLMVSKLSTSHPLFGSMGSCDFNALVAAFDVECKKAGYAKSETSLSTPSSSYANKRTYSQTSSYQTTKSSRGGRGGGRGGGSYKRGRGRYS